MSGFKELRNEGSKNYKVAREMIRNHMIELVSSNNSEKETFEFMMACLEIYMVNEKYDQVLATINQIEDFWESDLNNQSKISTNEKYEKIYLAKITCLIDLGESKQALDHFKEIEDNALLKKGEVLDFAIMFFIKNSYQESEYCFEKFFKMDALDFEAVCSYTDLLYKSNRKREVAHFVIDKFLLFHDTIESIDYICSVCGYLFQNNNDDEVVEVYDFISNQIDILEKVELLNQNPKTHLDLLMVGFEASFYTENYRKVIDIGNEICVRFADDEPHCIDPKFYCMMAESHYNPSTRTPSQTQELIKELSLDYLYKALSGYDFILKTFPDIDEIEIYDKIDKINTIIVKLQIGQTVNWEEAELWL